MTRIIVTGDRRWECLRIAETVVARLSLRYGRESVLIVHGAASGVDSAFAEAARMAGVTTEPHPADWSRGKKAGPERNVEMIRAGCAFVVACHKNLGRSRGTRNAVELALRAGIPVYLIADNGCRPVRVVGFEGCEVLVRERVAVESQGVSLWGESTDGLLSEYVRELVWAGGDPTRIARPDHGNHAVPIRRRGGPLSREGK
jgi:hypothetical protein